MAAVAEMPHDVAQARSLPVFDGLQAAEAPVHAPPVTIVHSEERGAPVTEVAPITDSSDAAAVTVGEESSAVQVEEYVVTKKSTQPAVLTAAEEEQQKEPQHFVDTDGRPVSYVDEFGQPANFEERDEDRIETKVATVVRSTASAAQQPRVVPVSGAAPLGPTSYIVSSQQNIIFQQPLTAPRVLPVTQPLLARPIGTSQMLPPQPLLDAPTASTRSMTSHSQPQVQQPTVYNISPEVFARLLQGGSLSSTEMQAISSSAVAGMTPELSTDVHNAETAVEAPVAKEAKSPTKKKALKSSKKKSEVCC